MEIAACQPNWGAHPHLGATRPHLGATRRPQVRMRPPIRLFNHSPHIVFRLAERPSVFKFEGRHGRGELTCLVG